MTARREIAVALAVTALACGLYLPALGAGFYSDDYQWLGRMNPTLERPTYVFSVFFRDFNPVLHASFVVDWLAGGGAAWAWHAHSILIHGLCTALLFLLCRRQGANVWLAAAATLTWALNVRVSEAVIWPAARGHSLATLFALAALVVLGTGMRRRRVIAVVLLVVGLLAKETALFPLLLVPLFLPDWRREWRLLVALGSVVVAFLVFNLAVKGDLHTSDAGAWMLALKAPFVLLRPLGLGDVYGFNAGWLLAVLVAFAAAAWGLRRTVGLTGLVWVAVCAVPIIPLQKLSSRYLYMLAIGYALVLCGVVTALAPRLKQGSARRLAVGGLAVLLALVWIANVVNIQREIVDYRLLAEPYAACVESLLAPLRSVAPGETVTVIDTGPRDAIPRLHESIAARGNMSKLIPYRREGVDGLIALPDLLNVVRERTPGMLGSTADATLKGPRRWFVYDGRGARELSQAPSAELPPEVVFTARWGDADDYFGDSGPEPLAASSR